MREMSVGKFIQLLHNQNAYFQDKIDKYVYAES